MKQDAGMVAGCLKDTNAVVAKIDDVDTAVRSHGEICRSVEQLTW